MIHSFIKALDEILLNNNTYILTNILSVHLNLLFLWKQMNRLQQLLILLSSLHYQNQFISIPGIG